MLILAAKKSRGFSLVELMVSMGIIATTLLMIMGVFMTVFKSSQKAVDMTAGTIFAESVMNKELRTIMSDSTLRGRFFTLNYSINPYVEGVERLNNALFTYKMYASDISMPSWRTDNKMKKVDVVVWWWAAGSEHDTVTTGRDSRSGYGILRTEVTRIVNQQAVY